MRFGPLLLLCGALLAANGFLWAQESAYLVATGTLDEGCCGDKKRNVDKTDMVLAATRDSREAPRPLGPLQAPCTGCWVIMTTTQVWCKYRPPGTECFMGPIYDNFRWERMFRFYECTGGMRGVCCGHWIHNGCCNTAEFEPPCDDPDADFQCLESPDCPE
jgi:hypothetical protein